MKIIIQITIVALLGTNAGAYAQSLEKKVDSLIQPFLQEYPGIQIAISRNSEMVLTKSYGYADLAKKTPLENLDLFRIYSVSKLVTTTALLQLVEKGLIDPEKPIESYIPTWRESKVNPYKTKITPLSLAMHRSGLRHYSGLHEVYDCQQCDNVDQAVDIFEDSYLLFEPGTQRSYSSWGYVLLSKLVEAVAQVPYGTYVDRNILQPSGMHDTHLFDRQKVWRIARAYEMDGDKIIDVSYANPSCKFGAGGYISNATDLIKFAMAFHNAKLISPPMMKLAMEGDISNSIFITGGVSAGGRAILGINVDSGDAVVILGNQRGSSFDKILFETLNLLN